MLFQIIFIYSTYSDRKLGMTKSYLVHFQKCNYHNHQNIAALKEILIDQLDLAPSTKQLYRALSYSPRTQLVIEIYS